MKFVGQGCDAKVSCMDLTEMLRGEMACGLLQVSHPGV